MTGGSESECFPTKLNSFIEFVGRFSLIDAKLPAIRNVHRCHNLWDVLDHGR